MACLEFFIWGVKTEKPKAESGCGVPLYSALRMASPDIIILLIVGDIGRAKPPCSPHPHFVPYAPTEIHW